MHLPQELLATVAEHLSNEDIKQLRLVCKALAEDAAPFLFTSIFLTTDPFDLEQAELALQRFKALIKTVVLSPLKYPTLTRHEYRVCVVNGSKAGSQLSPCFDAHLGTGYWLYRRIEARAGRASSRTEMEEMLHRVLREAPKVRKVVITHRRRFKRMEGQELQRYCGCLVCTMEPKDHAVFRLTPLQSLGMVALPDVARPLLSMISVGAEKIREVVMEPRFSGTTMFAMPIAALNLPARYDLRVSTFMANLTKLRINVNDSSHGERFLRGGVASRFVAQARNLEYLFLETSPIDENATYLFTLGGCRLPRLRVLVLKATDMDAVDLASFLKYFPRLKHFVLEEYIINGYSAQSLLEQIKGSTDLEALHVNCDFWGFEHQWSAGPSHGIPHLPYWDYFGDVDKYYHHNGPNPFSLEQLDRYIVKMGNRLDIGLPRPYKAKEYYETYFC